LIHCEFTLAAVASCSPRKPRLLPPIFFGARRRLKGKSLNGLPIVFLSRHDRGHGLSPSDTNYRANIDLLALSRRRDRSRFALGLRLVQGEIAARHRVACFFGLS
jgi:hypothetical protein